VPGVEGPASPGRQWGGSVSTAANPLEQGWPGHGMQYGARDTRWTHTVRNGKRTVVTGNWRTTVRPVAAASQACHASASPPAHASCLVASPCSVQGAWSGASVSSTQEDLDESETDADRHVLTWPRLSPRRLAASRRPRRCQCPHRRSCTFRERIIPALRKTGKIPS
jgi:hypothetical protein